MNGNLNMNIGKRTQIKDLRQIWPTEPEFSDWLVTEQGLNLISEDLGISVENPRRESRPGDYPADVVGNRLGDENHIIVIENQFGKTDHDHLGKLLTYAAMHSAMTGIWISEHISNDHRKVIDWLNENTPPHVSLYLAQLKAYQIGDSAVAPQLDVVSSPNPQEKISRASDNAQKSPTQKWRLETWRDILDYIDGNNPPFSVQSPSDDHWSSIAIGRAGFLISLTLVPRNQRIGCELIINPSWKDAAFNQLLAQKDAIEEELGPGLNWRPMPERASARILLEAPIDPRNDDNRQAMKEWMLEKSVAFHKAFHDRVRGLTPNGPGVSPAETEQNDAFSERGDNESINSKTEGPTPMRTTEKEVSFNPDAFPAMRGGTMTTRTTTIQVVRGSVTQQRVDAVVNAANPDLADGGGITGVIFDAAGPGLPAEIRQKYPSGTPIGTAVITGGHGLRQPYIIHTPGPDCRSGRSDNDEMLASSYRSCLEVADANKLTSIAYCSISTGIYGCPLSSAASLALRTVYKYLDAHPDTSLERVIFAMFGDEEHKAFAKAYAEVTA